MPISHAFRFFKRFKSDTDFRHACYRCTSRQELMELLGGMTFTEEEFSEVVNVHHVKCQTEDEAWEVKQIEWFFHLIPEK
jgi:hypothetical protein